MYPKRWQRGFGIKGPDYIFCRDTGKQPMIIKATYSGKFFVGAYDDVQLALSIPNAHDFNGEFNTHSGYVNIHNNRESAINKFEYWIELFNSHNQKQKNNLLSTRKRYNPTDNANGTQDSIKQKILSYIEKGELKDTDLIDLYQFIVLTIQNCFPLQVNIYQLQRWPRAKANYWLKKLGQRTLPESTDFMVPGSKFFSQFSNLQYFDMLNFIESIQPDKKMELEKFQEPMISKNKWEHNYNPECGCGICEWARANRSVGGVLWLGNEFQATSDAELKDLIQVEGDNVFNYLDEEDIENPTLRQLYKENDFNRIYEELRC